MLPRLLKSLFASSARSSKSRSTAHLRLESLEARDVPAVVNLTTPGASGVINNALFRQTDSIRAREADPFVRLRNDDGRASMQQGYNSDDRPVQFDEVRNRNVNHAIRVQDLPLVTINGIVYREILLDVRQSASQPRLTLDELRIYVSDSPNLSGYRASNDRLDGVRAIYDMDGGGNNRVLLNTELSGGRFGDMRLNLPNNLFANANLYFYLYSKFGATTAGRDDTQTWAIPTAPPVGATGSISGVRFNDFSGDGVRDEGEPGLAGWTVYLDTNNNGSHDAGEQSTVTDQNGFYQFAGLAGDEDTPVTYFIRTVDQNGWLESGDSPFVVTLNQDGQSFTGADLGVMFAPQ